MKEIVSHTGRVANVTPQSTTVVLLQEGACAGCHAAGLCGMAEWKEKAVEVPTDPRAHHAVGDEVELVLRASMGMKAVWLAYFVPLLVLLAVTLGLLLGAGVPEVPAALAGLGATAVYYGLLWLFRGRLQNEYVFTIKE